MSEVEKLMKMMLPQYECTLPFSGQKAEFTPFKVKDAKNISIILEEKNKNLILKTLIEILKNNTRNVDVMNLCLADAEYLFLQIRSKSIDEQLNLLVNNEPVQLNISEVSGRNEIINKEVTISSGHTFKLCTPKLHDLLNVNIEDENAFVQKSIKSIIIAGEIFDIGKYHSDEITKIIENMSIVSLNEIKNHLKRQPELYAKIQTTSGEREVSGSLTFFTFL